MGLTGESKMTQQLSILTGCSAGATESFVVVPFELVKIKCDHCFYAPSSCILTSANRLQDKTSTFAGPIDVVKQVIRKEGVLGLYAGMEATFWRFVHPHSSIPDHSPKRLGTSGGMVDTSDVFIKSVA